MTTINSIPKEEPKISIGLVLPEDKQSELSVEICSSDHILYLDKIEQDTKQTDLIIQLGPNGILVNDEPFKDLHIKNRSREHSDFIYLKSIKAGRGFHWQKSIPIKILGDLHISSLESYLFVVNKVYLEDYLMCVATSEMSGSCPLALLEAQTIVARSWILAAAEKKHKDLDLDACNDDCCQRYQGIANINQESIKAAKNTRGIVLVHDDEVCDTRYSKSCGGISENNENVWDTDPKPYLKSVVDSRSSENNDVTSENGFRQWIKRKTFSFCGPEFITESKLTKFLGSVDVKGQYFRWKISYNNEEITDLINSKTKKSFSNISSLIPLKRGESGRITELKIVGKADDGSAYSILIESEYEIRRTLHHDFLYSSAFTVETNSNDDNGENRFTLRGAGWGHGVGLCQIGALGMALDGRKTDEILFHYYHSSKMRNTYA